MTGEHGGDAVIDTATKSGEVTGKAAAPAGVNGNLEAVQADRVSADAAQRESIERGLKGKPAAPSGAAGTPEVAQPGRVAADADLTPKPAPPAGATGNRDAAQADQAAASAAQRA